MDNAKSDTEKPITFGPYSPIRQVGEFYFLSGVTGVDANSKTAPEDIAGQTRQLFVNLEAVLKAAGLSFNDIVKTTIFLTDMSNFAAVNEVYMSYFSEPRPARSTVGVQELPRVATNTALKIEIEAIASRST